MSEETAALTSQEPAQTPGLQQPKRKRRSTTRIVVGVLLGVLLLVLLLPFTLYIPLVQDFACRQAVAWLNSSSDDFEYHVGQVRIGFPLQLSIQDVAMLDRQQGDTLVSVGSIRTGVDHLPIHQPYFVANSLRIDEVKVRMDSLTQSFGLRGSLQQLELERIEADPATSELRIGKLVAAHPDLSLYVGPSAPDTTQSEPFGWFIYLKEAQLLEGHIALDMSPVSLADAQTSLPASPYLDYNHLDLQSLELQASEIRYDADRILAHIEQLTAHDQNSGLAVQQFATRFAMEDQSVRAEGLELALSGTGRLQGDVSLHLGMLDSIPSGYAEAHLQAALDSANLIRLAAPYLPQLPHYWVNATTDLALDVRLTPDSLDLRRLEVDIPRHTQLNAEAFALQPFDNDNRTLAATVKGDLHSSDFLLSAFVAKPSDRPYRLPDSLAIDLEASQRAQRFTARVDLRQQLLDILSAEGDYDVTTEGYHLLAFSKGLDVQDFVPTVPVDQVDIRVQADGRHFRFPSKWTRLNADLQIDTLAYTLSDGKREQLNGLTAKGSLLNGSYEAELHSAHPTVQLDAHLDGLYQKDTLTAKGRIDAPWLDLAHLPGGLGIADLGRLSFCSTLDAAYNWGDVAEGNMRIDSLRYEDAEVSHQFDNIMLTLESRPGMLYADVTGGDATLSLNTERGISEFPDIVSAMSTEVNRQLTDLRFDFNALQHSLPQGMLDFHMAQDNPFYRAINYFGYQFNSIDIASYNLYNLNLDASIVGLRNDDRTIDFDTIIAEIRPCQYQHKEDSLSDSREGYRLNAHALHIDPKARDTYDIHAHGLLMPDSVLMDVKYVDGNYVTLYDAAASLAIGNDTVTLRLEKDPVLYAQPFKVNPDNYISLMEYRGGMEHKRTNTKAKVLMTGPRGMSLDVYSRKAKDREIGNQMMMRLQNLDLDYASQAVMWDGDVNGRMNLTLLADLYPDSLGAQLRSGIKGFRLGEYKADTLSFDGLMHMGHGRRDVEGTLTIDSIVKLQLGAALADTVNLRATISDLPLPLANLYMPSSLRLDGTTSGQLTLRGKSFDQARMDAFIAMNDATVCITDLDGRLSLPGDTLRIRNNRLNINDYKIRGVNQSPITLRGSVDMRKELANPDIDLRIQGDKVQLANNQRLRLPGQYIYGRLPVSTDIRVRGRLSDLDVTGKLQVLSGTDLKYFLQDDPLESTSRVDRLVEFVSFRQMDRELAHSAIRPLVDATEEGISVELKIDIDRDVKVDAYLPGADNNHVAIVGGGPLVMQCAPDGSLTMSGVYDVTSGTVDYKLPILPMTKKFNILNNSMVSWNGNDPGSPSINIQASENVRTTVSNSDGSRIVQFVVTIGITGTLDALDMTFTCSAPDDGAINSEIESMTDEERSKTALMLLVAQTYMGSSNNSSVGMGTANAALNSVLNRQMDQMLGSALKNTDVDLGIDTYSTEAGAARTDYSIKVSQRFLNDRFRATFGGRVSTGGDASMGNGARLGDMSLEWLIKKDGTHYLKLYRRYNYQSVLEGEVIESGIGYAQERTAYKFKQLLIPASSARQQQIQSTIRELQLREEEEERKQREEEEEDDEFFDLDNK